MIHSKPVRRFGIMKEILCRREEQSDPPAQRI